MGSSSEGFSVDEQAPDELGGGENAFVFNTSTRTYPLLAETIEEKQDWIAALRGAIELSATLTNGYSITATYTTE